MRSKYQVCNKQIANVCHVCTCTYKTSLLHSSKILTIQQGDLTTSWLYTNSCKIILFQETFCQTDINLGSDWQVIHNKTNSAHSRGVIYVILY